jgi:hypothetical protein
MKLLWKQQTTPVFRSSTPSTTILRYRICTQSLVSMNAICNTTAVTISTITFIVIYYHHPVYHHCFDQCSSYTMVGWWNAQGWRAASIFHSGFYWICGQNSCQPHPICGCPNTYALALEWYWRSAIFYLSAAFDDFHRHSAAIIRTAVFGLW